ncbi:hypothetical protein MTR67_042779 [Solanum verrucosum]|uniref:Retrotransposon gag domain-containing protein n=1 Tax=Solanum verrucosum TaxID=315347 RepID=A0AAF0UQJ3_SOLVR|nr:hypothetical protein MTR67_042779 [Solanum verrucosum]
MQVAGNDRVELASYQLKDVANIWYTQWKENMSVDAAFVTWGCFTRAFLDRYAPYMVANPKAQMSKFLSGKSSGGNHSHLQQDQNSRAPGSKSQGSVSRNRTYPTCPKCGKNHPSECLIGKEGFLEYGQSNHKLKDYPSARQGQRGNINRAQSTVPAAPAGPPNQQGALSGTGGGQCQNSLDKEAAGFFVTSELGRVGVKWAGRIGLSWE